MDKTYLAQRLAAVIDALNGVSIRIDQREAMGRIVACVNELQRLADTLNTPVDDKE